MSHYIDFTVCTPLGFVRLFGVVGQVLVKPHLLRDVNDEYHAFNFEEASVRRKLATTSSSYADAAPYDPLKVHSNAEGLYQRRINGSSTNGQQLHDEVVLNERLREIESDQRELDKLRSSSAFQRNFVYPIAMILLLFLTGITVLLVCTNTLELLIGIKALPLSTRQFTLGISSLSKLGPLGAALEVCIIFYLGATSSVGFYTMPFMRHVRPRRRRTSLSQLIVNCAIVLILSSALPLLSRILGISNFDLLGDFGEIEWLGNFQIVFLYNLVFGTATTLCIVNKFTATVRRELCARLWMCTFSLAIAIGAALLLPLSIASNEVLTLYPNSYYVKWLNSSLIQGLWNHVFLFSNLSLFVLLPFSYLFAESAGFLGHHKGIISRAYETFTVFSLLAFVVLGLTYVISALIDPEKSSLQTLLNLGSYHLPFLYSCVSFLGVLLLLVCTPLGFVRLFGVASVRRKLATTSSSYADAAPYDPLKVHSNAEGLYQRRINGSSTNGQQLHDEVVLNERLREIESDQRELDKLRSSSAFQRNFVYPIAMILLLFLTGITVLLVCTNTLELLIGIKALPLSTRQFTLGISSLSKLGPLGAALEVCIIFYLALHLPWASTRCPLCGISALPLLSRILGISNFDLLGDFGEIEWLGNFQIVFLYNLVFGTATTLCIVNKYTATVRRELCARLVENYLLVINYISVIN
uniref:Uncharacterized protein n=1 Tax=Lutzomyia longipalpis TaxID=7200 RepID=A0A1B0CLH0_LUTLO